MKMIIKATTGAKPLSWSTSMVRSRTRYWSGSLSLSWSLSHPECWSWAESWTRSWPWSNWISMLNLGFDLSVGKNNENNNKSKY